MTTRKRSRDPHDGAQRRAELAGRRAAAVELLRTDLSLAEVARRVGVSREAVRLWRKALAEGGVAKLVAPAQGQGRPARLSIGQQRKLVGWLLRPATARGFPSDEWTTARVRAFLELDFGTTFSVPGLWRMLERFGFGFSRGGGWRPRPWSDAVSEASKLARKGAAPWGFSRAKDGALVANAMERRAVVVAQHLHRAGFSLRDIVRVLQEAGVVERDGTPIARATVAELLRSELRHAG